MLPILSFMRNREAIHPPSRGPVGERQWPEA